MSVMSEMVSDKPRQDSNSSESLRKGPPHSVEAERAVLGGLMLDQKAWERIIGHITEYDFYKPEHAVIFLAISQLFEKNKPSDVVTVTDILKAQNTIQKAGGESYIYQLADVTPSTANIVAYADIVHERAVLRKLMQVGHDIVADAFDVQGKDIKQVLDQAETKVFQIADQHNKGSGPVDISTLLARATDRLDELYHSDQAITGLATGYKDLDEMTSGLQPGDLIIIAGRPSMGKTAFAMNIAEHAALTCDKPTLVFSLEMPADSLALRMLSSLGRIDQHVVRTGKLRDNDWPRITSAVSMLSEAKLFVDDTPALTPGELRARARRIAREHEGIGLIVVDYLQLMTTSRAGENRSTEISAISRSLKALAKELNVPVVALSQLNRSLETRPDKRPVMSDLRESGAIEQDADLIGFIYRDEVYNEESPRKGIAEIIIAKHRNGPIGKIHLTFLGKYTRFENFSAQAGDLGVGDFV